MDDEGSASDNGIIDDDPIDHWKRREESQRKRMKLMVEEKEKLQKEIDTMNSFVAAATNISDDDIIKINAGGKIISVLRSTLTLASDTVFSYMFSGRWEESLKRDENGCVFLNHDPELIELIVNFLRTKAIEDPSSVTAEEYPKIPEGKEYPFRVLLNYFGLTDFFYPPSVFLRLDIDNVDIIQPHDSDVTVTKSEKKIQLTRTGTRDQFYTVACKSPLDSSGEGSCWKVTIDVLPNDDWLFLGIVGNLDVSNKIFADPTRYGWAGGSQVYQGETGRNVDSGWTNFTEGECLHFHLKAKKITMFSVQKNKKLTMDIATTGAYYIHVNTLYIGTKWTIEPLGEEEYSRFL